MSQRPLEPPTRRKRIDKPAEEDAAKRQYGEFEGVECLTVSEVKLLLDSVWAQGLRPPPDNDVYKKTFDYVTEFTNIKTPETAISVRETIRANQDLNSFEVAQLAYLRPESVDEAKTLIPSLERYQTDDEIRRLQDTLDEVRTLMKYE